MLQEYYLTQRNFSLEEVLLRKFNGIRCKFVQVTNLKRFEVMVSLFQAVFVVLHFDSYGSQ